MRVNIDMPQLDPKTRTIISWMINIEDCEIPQATIQEIIPEDDFHEEDNECDGRPLFAPKSEPTMLLGRDGTMRPLHMPFSDSKISRNQSSPFTKSVKSQSTQTSEAYVSPGKRMDYSAAVKSTPKTVAVQPAVVHSSDRKPTPVRKASVTGTTGPYHGNSRKKGRGGNKKPRKTGYHAKPQGHFGFEKKQRALDQPWR